MAFSPEFLAELELLAQFGSPTTMAGLKVHSQTADQQAVDAAARLYEKGLITQPDGGFLTPLGCEALEHVHMLKHILNNSVQRFAAASALN
jgi:uncharacterized protein (TIGR02647 family)